MASRHDHLLESLAEHHRRKRRRQERLRRRRRAGLITAAIGLVVALALAGAGVGTGTALANNCDLDTLRPVAIGQNSFVFAADGSLLGSIPAERNREPVSLA